MHSSYAHTKMPNERSPLITHVRIGQPRRRYPHNVLRRFCTIAISSTLLWFFLVFIFTALFSPGKLARPPWDHGHHRHGQWSWPGCKERSVSHEQLKKILLDTPAAAKEEEWSRYYTHGAHMAGQNYSQVVWTKDKWEEFGVSSHIATYDVWLNRPVDHRLALLHKGKDDKSWKVTFEASLKEDVLDEDPTTSFETSTPTFHAYSANGNVTASYVYVNYATYQDFEDLRRANVSLEGKVAIARYGGIFRGLKAKRAQEMGMVGILLYSDPGDDGQSTEANGEKPYPEGKARQASSVQRGSMEFLSLAPGDPTTPGWPSLPGAPHAPADDYVAHIPSIPISYRDALPILKALNGHGPKAKDFNQYWTRNLGLEYKGVEYNIGPTPDDIAVNLYNEQDYITTPIWNVIGVINGSIPDEVIVVGNHRDAWIVGGAGDPNSGSAVLNEVIRSFGKAVKEGWKPLRTIVFASWDGEEYSLLGSTEWVEEYLPWITVANVAYVNVDVGVAGPQFEASAAPLLNDLIYKVTSEVQSPNQTRKGQTVGDVWDGNIRTMGSGSDFTAFQDFAGVPCLNVGFGFNGDAPVYHYHSNYDSFYWMKTYGDPGFNYHRTMSQILGLAVAELSDLPVIRFRALDYANALDGYINKAEKKADEALGHRLATQDVSKMSEDEIAEIRASTRSSLDDGGIRLTGSKHAELKRAFAELHKATWELNKKAIVLDQRADALSQKASQSLPWWKWPAKFRLGWEIRQVNNKYKQLERNFLYSRGLDSRPWFKHVVFAPGLWTGYAGAVFPGIMESIDTDRYDKVLEWVSIIEDCLKKAAQSL